MKDWLPVITSVVALLGIWATISRARATFEHGRVEARKDRQRELVADLIATGRELNDIQMVVYVAIPLMSRSGLLDWTGTDTSIRQAELTRQVRALIVRGLAEVADPRLRPHILSLSVQLDGILDGDGEAIADTNSHDDVRFKASLVVLGRARQIKATIVELQTAAIASLPVHIQTPPTRISAAAQGLWKKVVDQTSR
ncbi:hypothetical protein RQCS_11830 [Rhodococcus qingshengii]|uniref:hypothetical protein n=1 Tax=Rhodococcus qingshengii TaxID=334542 RepID=UPI0007E57A22|nr:hypothetical protein [Rhodococcus qingshengii]BCF81638.1 hypothetical protein RQCS_11830 [Rhodococcus qingshengii]